MKKLISFITLLTTIYKPILVKSEQITLPKLLWQQSFDTDINFVSVSSDGTKVLVTTIPNIETPKTSGLYCFNKEGSLIWKYEASDSSMLAYVKFCNNGQIYCGKLVKRKMFFTQEFYPEIIYVLTSVLCFDERGNLLWEKFIKSDIGDIEVSDNGNYILVHQGIKEAIIGKDEKLFHYFYLFNSSGDKLWEYQANLYSCPFNFLSSLNGKYIGIKKTLYQTDKLSILTVFPIKEYAEIIAISPLGNYVVLENFQQIDMPKEIFLFKRNGVLIKKYNYSGITPTKFSPNEKYFIGASKNLYIFETTTGKLLWKKIYDNDVGTLHQATFSKDSKYVISILGSWFGRLETVPNKIYLYKIDGTQLWCLELNGEIFLLPKRNMIDFSSDTKYIAIGCSNKLYFYDNSDFIK